MTSVPAPLEPEKWSVALETPRKRPAIDPDAALTLQSAESLLAIEPPEFTAPMGLTLDMDRVKVVISKHLRNRMRLVDRYNRLLLEGPIREEALKDKGDKRCRPVDNDPVAIQVIFGLTRRIEELDRIEDEKLRATTMVQLYKQLTNLVTAFEAANTRIFTEMWSLVEMHQRQAEQKDKKTLRGLADAGDAELIKLAEDADAKSG